MLGSYLAFQHVTLPSALYFSCPVILTDKDGNSNVNEYRNLSSTPEEIFSQIQSVSTEEFPPHSTLLPLCEKFNVNHTADTYA